MTKDKNLDDLINTVRNSEPMKREFKNLIEKYPQTARAVKLDVTKSDEVQAAITEAVLEFGRIDIVVNNAGYGLIGTIEEASDSPSI